MNFHLPHGFSFPHEIVSMGKQMGLSRSLARNPLREILEAVAIHQSEQDHHFEPPLGPVVTQRIGTGAPLQPGERPAVALLPVPIN